MAPRINPALLGDPDEPVKIQYDGDDSVPKEFRFEFEQKPFFLVKGQPSKTMSKVCAKHFMNRAKRFSFQAEIQVLTLQPVASGDFEVSGKEFPKGKTAFQPAAPKALAPAAPDVAPPGDLADLGAPVKPKKAKAPKAPKAAKPKPAVAAEPPHDPEPETGEDPNEGGEASPPQA